MVQKTSVKSKDLANKLGDIATTVGETVIFHIGFRKNGAIDILGMDIMPPKCPEKPMKTTHNVSPRYIG